MWELYDTLLAGIPEDIIVTDYAAGVHWTFVRAGALTGTAITVKARSRRGSYRGPIIGEPLAQVAALVKSWDFIEASIGAAAVNAYYNSVEKVKEQGGLAGIDLDDTSKANRIRKSAFPFYADEIQGRKVLTVGHFPDIEARLAPICQLTILERNPEPGDYPDSACEYLMEEQDYAFITGMTVINKTLPRLLALAKGHARIILVGPSAPMTRSLHAYGVSAVSGFCVTDPELLANVIRRGKMMDIFDAGYMTHILYEGQ